MSAVAAAEPPRGYSTEPVAFAFDDVALTLQVPTHLEDHVDREALLRDAAAPEPPYWLHLWTGNLVLTRAVAAQGDWSGRRVVDVGCGLGLAGIVAARRGARVVLLELVYEALCLARANARANGCAVGAVQTDARRPGLRGRFDLILLADVTYDPELQEALGAFVAEHLAPAGEAWCAESVRNHDPGFRRACERYGLRVGERELRELDEGRPVAVRLTEVRR